MTSNQTHSYNDTSGHFPNSTQHQLSSFFMQSFKSTMSGFALRCQLGTVVSAIMCGWVYREAYEYFRHNKDRLLLRILVSILVGAMAIEHILGIIDSAVIVTHFWNYGQIMQMDVGLEYGKMFMMSVVLAPATLMFFSLRAWAVNGKSAVVTILATLGVLAQFAAGVAVVVIGLENPFHYDGTMDLIMLQETGVWADRCLKTYRLWACITVFTNVSITAAIFITLTRFRGKTVEIDQFLRLLAMSLMESMLPILACTITFCALIIANQGWGGSIRIVSEVPGPLCIHAILHSLLARDRMREILKEIAGGSAGEGNMSGTGSGGLGSGLGGRFTPDVGLVHISTGGAGDETEKRQNRLQQQQRRVGADPKFNCDLDLEEIVHLPTSGAASSSRLPLNNTQEQNLRNYYHAWEDPVHRSYGGNRRGEYGFSLGSREYRAEQE